MAELPGKKNKNKFVVMAIFSSTQNCPQCLKDFQEFSQIREVDITPNEEGKFYAPWEWFNVKCPHNPNNPPLIRSAYG